MCSHAPVFTEKRELLPCFDPLGNGDEFQASRHRDCRLNDRIVFVGFLNVSGERLIDLHLVDLEILEVAETRVPFPKIVN